jgi:phthiocerol/phenolphthiocerol synthesis type-I polyketide synthase D
MRIPELERWLAAHVAERCGFDADAVELDRPLIDYGLSSRDAVELAGRLEDLLDRTLPNTLVWDHPTIESLAAALLGAPASTSADRSAMSQTASQRGRPDTDVAVAVIGVGCRLPGDVCGPQDFWRLLERGGDGVGEMSARRWRGIAATDDRSVLGTTTRAGGFLRDIAGFDAEFFAISPREARRIDPQQRLVLEVGWEALEHAGISPDSLRGSATGVFVGISSSEYGARSLDGSSAVDAWSSTGGALSIAANRLSYALDLRGPSIAVDTACSSSLVAVHLGMQSLRAGESDLVIAAGTNLLLGRALTAAFHEMGLISPTGHCQPFSSSADGIVRAEGAGVVVLKRLPDAERDGDRVLAVLRGSAVNQDGRSGGLTAPNAESQEDVLRSAYAAAGLNPAEVDYVEAHGTGTILGDPIEARALGAVLGSGRHGSPPLLVGSVKSNLGHLEAAAGIAGLIKVVLAIEHDRIPPSLHYRGANPEIDFAGLGLAVVERSVDWPSTGRPARAGVSAFGFGGTNAHVVVEAPARPAVPPSTAANGPPPAARGPAGVVSETRLRHFVLAGPGPARVRDSADQLADWLEGDGASATAEDLEFTLLRRMSGRARTAVLARDRPSLIAGLRACAAGETAANVIDAQRAGSERPGDVWVFSGHGSQWAGMALRLIAEEPVFADAIDELDDVVGAEAGFSVRDELRHGGEVSAMERVQPVLFAVQVALTRLLRANGLEPAAVIGHSVGEVAAAVAAGALTLEDGARVVALRSRLLGSLSGHGSMALLEVSPAELAPILDGYEAIDLAAFNAPGQTAVTGPTRQVEQLVAAVQARGLLARLIKVTAAAHSRLVEPVVGQLVDGLGGLAPRKPAMTFYSTALEDPCGAATFAADYWAANLRRPVRFAAAVAAAAGDGHQRFVEVSPHPILAGALSDNLAACQVTRPLVLCTGRRCDDEVLHLHGVLAALVLGGSDPVAGAHRGGRLLDVPTTRWRHEPHWLEPPAERGRPPRGASAHATLGERVDLPGDSRLHWRAELTGDGPGQAEPGQTMPPGRLMKLGGWLEIARAAATDAFGASGRELTARDLVVHAPLPLGDRTSLSTTLDPASRTAGRLAVHARLPGGAWRAQLTATLELTAAASPAPDPRLEASMHLLLPAAPTDGEANTDRSREVLGSALDALVESLGPAGDAAWLPRSVARVSWRGPLDDAAFARISVAGEPGDVARTAEVQLADADGRVLFELHGLALARVPRAGLPSALNAKLLAVEWRAAARPRPPRRAPPRPQEAASTPASAHWLIVGDPADPLRAALAGGLVDRDAAMIVTVAERPTLDPAGSATADLSTALSGLEALDADAVITHVVLLAPPPAAGDLPAGTPQRAEGLVLTGARIVQALSERAAATPTRLWFVTTGAAAVLEDDRPDPVAAALRGLVRVLAYEHPELAPTWVDMPADRGLLDELVEELCGGPDRSAGAGGREREDEVALRGGHRYVARLVRPTLDDLAPLPNAPGGSADPQRTVRPDGAYLVTGGLGGLGLLIARWLAERGAARVVLNGRSEPSPDACSTLAELRGLGCDVVVVRGDIAAPGVAERAVAACGATGARLRGVVHAAAVIEDRVALRLDAESLGRVWSAKATGAWRLAAAAASATADGGASAPAGQALDWWVGFSSAAALVGSPGQAAYAAANAFLDALAAWQRAAGVAATTIHWGTWSEVGRAAGRRADALRPISPAEGIDALAAVLGAGVPAIGVLELDVAELVEAFPEIGRIALFAGIVDRDAERAASPGRSWSGIDELDPADAARLIEERVHERIAGVLGIDPDRLGSDTALTAAGLDSLLAVRVRNALQQDFDVLVPPSLLLRGASIDELVMWLRETLRLGDAPPSDAPPRPAARVAPRDASERLVATAWAEALGTTGFGVTDRFADVGGDAVAARRVTELLSRRSGRQLVAGELLDRATIERQAELVREPESTSRSPLRLLRRGVASTPLFLFHPGGGDTLVYRQLVDQLDPSIEVWGLDRLPGAISVEQRAERYVELLRGTRSGGAFLVGGWSFGGALAYETALRLRAVGERVELVALIDTILPLPDPPELTEAAILEERFRRFADFLEDNYGKRVSLPYARMARLGDEQQTDVMIEAIVDAGLIDPETNAAILRHQRTSYLDVRALERYRPARYDGRVTYYSARDRQVGAVKDPRFEREDPTRGWNAVCGERLDVVTIPGHHLSVLDSPHVETLAKHLDWLLAEYRAAA